MALGRLAPLFIEPYPLEPFQFVHICVGVFVQVNVQILYMCVCLFCVSVSISVSVSVVVFFLVVGQSCVGAAILCSHFDISFNK